MNKTREYSIKSNISSRFLDAAVEFTNRAILYEKENTTDGAEYYHYIFSSIILCVSFLEANINELYSRIEDKNIKVKNEEIVTSLWSRGIPRTARYPIIEKYEILLDIIGDSKLDKSKILYQNIIALIRLRNALVHFEPEWTTINNRDRKENSLEKTLKNKYLLNPFMNEKTQAFFPDVCLSAGCSYWAIQNTAQFILEYYKFLNIEITSKKIYANIFDKISKLPV
jgi:hypothetical protein